MGGTVTLGGTDEPEERLQVWGIFPVLVSAIRPYDALVEGRDGRCRGNSGPSRSVREESQRMFGIVGRRGRHRLAPVVLAAAGKLGWPAEIERGQPRSILVDWRPEQPAEPIARIDLDQISRLVDSDDADSSIGTREADMCAALLGLRDLHEQGDVVRRMSWLDAAPLLRSVLAGELVEGDEVHRVVAPGLLETIVVAMPAGDIPIAAADVRRWARSPDEILRVARGAADFAIKDLRGEWIRDLPDTPPLMLIEGEQTCTSAAAMHAEDWLGIPAGGVIVAVPDAHHVIAAAFPKSSMSELTRGLGALAAFVLQMHENGHQPVSPSLYYSLKGRLSLLGTAVRGRRDLTLRLCDAVLPLLTGTTP
ncbi:hypothetical protein ACQP2F_15665 [Actinoplanes sp. CA-030573]|uniref:hypothetical protein n=1 Tax=Actinoplanes sp. CA-030573 TaxID=3239898 RepID=UPI003D8C7155